MRDVVMMRNDVGTTSDTMHDDVATSNDASNDGDVVLADASVGDGFMWDASSPDDGGEGGVVDDDSTPCRDFGTLPFGVSFAPDASRLLIASTLGASVLGTADWSVQRTFAAHRAAITGAAISADALRGASVGSDDRLRMWDPATGHQIAEVAVTRPTAVRFVSSGAAVVLLEAAAVRAFAWGTMTELWSTTREAGSTSFLAAAVGGTTVLVGGATGGLDLLSASNGAMVAHFDGQLGAFSPEGSKIVAASGRTLQVFDAASPLQAPITMISPLAVGALGVGPSGAWVAVAGPVGLEEQIQILHVPDGAPMQTLRTSYATKSLSASADGRWLAAGAGELYVFDVTNGATVYSNQRPAMIWGQSFSVAAPLVAFARVGGDPEIWDWVEARRRRFFVQPKTGNLGTVAFDPGGALLINYEHTGTLWAPDGASPAGSFTYQSGTEQPDRGGPLVFSPDGRMLVGGGSAATPGHLRIWNASTGQLVRETPAHRTGIAAIAWSPDGALIASSGDDVDQADASDASDGGTVYVVKLWHAADGTLLTTLAGHQDIISSVAFSPDATRLASADREGRVRLWSTSDGGLVREIAKPPSPRGLTSDAFNGSVVFSPDGRWLASRGVVWTTGHNAHIAIFRVADGTVVRELWGWSEGNVGALGWSPDGRYIVGGTGDALRLWCTTGLPASSPSPFERNPTHAR
jgi:WD40 repeat protein